MESLEDLAWKKFPDLSEAEKRVVQAAPNGSAADCSLGEGSDPEDADGTPEAPDDKRPKPREVRADLIRWLCVDREARELVDPRGVIIRAARITGHLDLTFAKVLFSLALVRCRLRELLYLQWAKMPLLSLEGSWTGAISADGLNVEGSLFLRNGFHAEGEVWLRGATIGGNLDAHRGTFKNWDGNALSADGIKVTGDVFLTGGFVAEGTVRLVGATIGGNLEADGGIFKNLNGSALNAEGIRVVGSVLLQDGFSAQGIVKLRGAEIKGPLGVVDVWLDRLDLVSARIIGPFFWQNIHKDPNRCFPDWEWKPSLDLTDAKMGSLGDDLDENKKEAWLKKGRLRLDGLVYDRIVAGSTDAKTRLKWLRLQPDELGFRPQPYEQLIAALRRMGLEHQVAKVAIAKQWDMRKHGALGWLGQNWFLYFAVGYGYRAWLAFVWLLVLVAIGGHVFSRAHASNMFVPSDQPACEKYENPKERELSITYPRFHPLLYSLDVVSPFDLGQKSHWRLIESTSYWKYEFYSLFQLFAGWVLLIVAAAVPAGLIKKD
jgi:hypothetical protein